MFWRHTFDQRRNLSDSHIPCDSQECQSLCGCNSGAADLSVLTYALQLQKSHKGASESTKEIATLNNGKNDVTLSSSPFPVKS